jgi:hypothetical protein
MSDVELEKAFMLTNHLHRRKLRLAIEDLKSAEKSKYPKMSEITTEYVCSEWLQEIGLEQYQTQFRQNLVDGRVLASLQRKDLDKHFRIGKRSHQTSILLAIDLLRRHNFDIRNLKNLRETQMKQNHQMDAQLWTNEEFVDWLSLLSLQVNIYKLLKCRYKHA